MKFQSSSFSSSQSSNHRRQNFTFTQPKMPKAHTHSSITTTNRLFYKSFIIFIFLLANGLTKINAVPTDSTGAAQTRPLLLQRALRDVTAMMTARLVQEEPKDIVATSTETTQLDQPQGQCLLDGVLVAETTVKCEQKAGCRAIQKTGHCCPDYKCDCQKDGKTYLNGDKLVDPDTPCTVCYCKGGEIVCSSAVCFHRDDCTPRYIPNRCCPEYDNCPVTNKTMVSSTLPPARPELPPVAALNLNITIKEITKPTEIRITDENKAKPIHQMLKLSSTTTTTTTTTSTTSTSTSTTTEATPTSAAFSTDAPISSSTTATILTLIKDPANYPFADGPKKHETVVVLPPYENYENSNAESELKNIDREVGNGSSKINIKREFMYVSTDGPPIKANFNETNGELSAAELLNWNNESNDSSSGLLLTDSDLDPDTAGSDNIYHIILSTDGPSESFGSGKLEELVPKISSTTEGFYIETSDSTPVQAMTTVESNEKIEKIKSFTEELNKQTTDMTTDAPAVPAVNKPKESTTTTKAITSTTQTLKSSTHHMEEDDTALPLESNPAYPSLPEDDFSIRDTNLPLSEVEDTAESDLKDQSRSYAHHLVAASKTVEDASMLESGSGSGSDTNIVMLIKDTPSVLAAFEKHEAASTQLPQKVQLMYSIEEEASSAETTISNSTDFQLGKPLQHELAENETGSGGDDSLAMMSSLESIIDSDFGSGGGSGSENGSDEVQAPMKLVMKEREPTTPRPTLRPTKEVDIDELGNFSGDGKSEPLDDPKLDAESVKADEKENDGVIQTDAAAPKSDIISVKLNPQQEKTLVQQPLPPLHQLHV